MKKIRLLALFIVFICKTMNVNSQQLFEVTDNNFMYNLSNKRILVITYEDCSYEETIIMSNKWKEWGAMIEIAANDYVISANTVKMTAKGLEESGKIEIKADILLNQIKPDKYDAIYIVGGDNFKLLIENYESIMKEILLNAYKNKKIISSFCHSPAVLSICDFVKGKNVVVEGKQERAMLLNAGAIVKNDIVMCDQGIITGRFPYSETFINTVAEKIEFPKGSGPLEQSIKLKNPTIAFIENLANTQLFQNKKIQSDTLDIIMKSGFKSIISESYSFNSVIKFYYTDNQEKINKIMNLLISQNLKEFSNRPNPSLAATNYFKGMFNNLSTIIFSFNDQVNIDSITSSIKKDQLNTKFVSYNGAACQNMLIASKALGIGGKLPNISYFFEIESELRNLLNVPDSYKLVNVLILGYSDFDFVPTVTQSSKQFIFNF